MILKTNIIENDIIFEENKINVIEFEELNVFRRMIYSFQQYLQFVEADEELMLLHDLGIINLATECLIVTDFYQINFQSPMIIKTILRQLEEEYRYQDHYKSLIQQINEKIENFSQQLFLDYSIDLVCKKLEIKDYLKILAIKPDTSLYQTPVERVSFLIKLTSELNLYRLIVLIDLKKYCTDNEMIEIYKLALYHDVKILLLESNREKELLDYEKKLIIEDDFNEYHL